MLPYIPRPSAVDRRWKPSVELAPNCPRCDSSNTKFCYYNNYSLSQPRYFCKGCRRYWTKGGSLRNVPVGGGCRRNRRGKSVVRIPADRVVTGSPDSIRPDLILDDPVANSRRSGGKKNEEASGSDHGSSIDLALLYAKFLNQRPEFDPALPAPAVEVDEPFDLIRDFLISSDYQMPAVELVQEQWEAPSSDAVPPEARLGDEFLAAAASTGELNFWSDQSSSCDSQVVLPAEGFVDDIFWSNYCSDNPAALTWESPQNHGLVGPVQLEEHLPLIPQPNIMNGNWSSFDISNYEVFPRP